MRGNIEREDILRELFNVGVGQAAATLSEIIDKKINLDVPSVKILNIEAGRRELDRFLSTVADGAVMVSSISFNRQLEGKISLIFPADKMHRFIGFCLHEEHSGVDLMDFSDIDFDTVKEVGNIILNAIIGELSNTVDIPVEYTLPEVNVLDNVYAGRFFEEKNCRLVLIMYLTFGIEGAEIEGAIVINMTLKSLDDILNTIDRLYDGR
ncbi:MAG: chemotaxis protein CheC [Sporolactobacillus sp.]|jgi:chemotaxis protein CheC|nr:chemotaxis protein CheC [Sporolactobacillus sp.]MCI1880774.1 chemotaxis protein CheC [Sporolactobacillus sp.]